MFFVNVSNIVAVQCLGCARDLGVLILVVFKQVDVKKSPIKLQLGLVKFNASYDWQLDWLQVRKPFDRGVKSASLKTTKLIFISCSLI